MLNKSIYEGGNGGELNTTKNNIQLTNSLYTLAYLKMFGGNIEASTVKENNIGELRGDWWGNNTNENSENWINSETERVLKNIALTSKSRFLIIQAVKKDTKKLEKYGNIDINVSYPHINKVEIIIKITEPNDKSNNRLIVLWDSTKKEVIEQKIL